MDMPDGVATVETRPADSAEFDRVWRRFRVGAAGVIVAVLAGAAVMVSLVWRSSSDTPSALKPQPLPADHLTGLGATTATFAASHTQPLPRQRYGPLIPDEATGDDTPTYDLGNSTGVGYIDTLIHAFPAGTTRTRALVEVLAQDLPADARLTVTTAPDKSCLVLTYTSAATASAGPYEDFGDGTVTVTLYGRPGAPYSATDVKEAYEHLNPTNDQPVCL